MVIVHRQLLICFNWNSITSMSTYTLVKKYAFQCTWRINCNLLNRYLPIIMFYLYNSTVNKYNIEVLYFIFCFNDNYLGSNGLNNQSHLISSGFNASIFPGRLLLLQNIAWNAVRERILNPNFLKIRSGIWYLT